MHARRRAPALPRSDPRGGWGRGRSRGRSPPPPPRRPPAPEAPPHPPRRRRTHRDPPRPPRSETPRPRRRGPSAVERSARFLSSHVTHGCAADGYRRDRREASGRPPGHVPQGRGRYGHVRQTLLTASTSFATESFASPNSIAVLGST